MRLYGVAVSDINCRLLVTALVANGDTEALELSQRISAGITGHETVTALTPSDRDRILRNLPNPLPSGLDELKDALAKDKRARA